MARGKAHSDETRAAVMAALLAGQGVNEVAATYKLDPSVVSRWRSQTPADQLQQLATKKAHDFGELLGDYLADSLLTLREQVRFFRNGDWLKEQSASELGTLHGIVADKAVRLLEAAERAASASETADSESEEAP